MTADLNYSSTPSRAAKLAAQFNTTEPHALRSASRAAQDDPSWFRKFMLAEFLDGGREFQIGIDCWGLIYSAYRYELGIQLPSYDNLSPQQQHEVSLQVEQDTVVLPWIDVPLQEMQPFDMVILRGLAEHGGRYKWMSNHMGIVTIPPFVMHIEDISGVMHLPIMNTDKVMKNDLLSRRVRRIVRHKDAV